MARLLMGKRGGSRAPTYDQLEVDEGWREWENAKQELVLVKRQLAEKKDELVLQLKTATQRLHEMLRKKEKDDAETTKSRRKELIDRLVAESLQRARSAETLAEERKCELEHLKFSAKFLHFQELELEVEECHIEIERLRAKLDAQTAGSPTLVAGKLRISPLPVASERMKTRSKRPKSSCSSSMGANNRSLKGALSVATESSAIRVSPNQVPGGQVRVLAPQSRPKRTQREGFVTKTRRRAVEAEYYKQVRLAQLEAECELEENLHIRAAREAKKVRLAEQKHQQMKQKVEAVKALKAALQVAEEKEGTAHASAEGQEEDTESCVVSNESPIVHKEGGSGSSVGTRREDQDPSASIVEDCVPGEFTGPDINPMVGAEVATTRVEEQTKQKEGERGANEGETQAKQKTYEEDDFDGEDEDEEDEDEDEVDDPDHDEEEDYVRSAWNLDPTPSVQEPTLPSATAHASEAELVEDDSDPDDSERKIWNLDPNPSVPETPLHPELANSSAIEERVGVWNLDPHTSEPSSATKEDVQVGDEEQNRVVWNTDPNPEGINAAHPSVSTDAVSLGEGVSRVEDAGWNPWNLDPKPADSEPTALAQEDQDTNTGWKVWNADPKPSAPGTSDQAGLTAAPVESVLSLEENAERNVWNLDPNPSSEKVARAALPAADLTEGAIAAEENESDTTPVQVDGTADDEEPEKSVWNLDPNPTTSIQHLASAEDPRDDTQTNGAVWNADPSPSTSASSFPKAREVSADEPSEAVSPWNLDPHTSDVGPEAAEDKELQSGESEAASPWNLDPHTSEVVPKGAKDNDLQSGECQGATPAEDPLQPHTSTSSAWNASIDDTKSASPPNTVSPPKKEKETHGLLDRAASTIQRWWGRFTTTVTGGPNATFTDLPPSNQSPSEDAEVDVAGERTPEYSYTPNSSPRDESGSDEAADDEQDAAW